MYYGYGKNAFPSNYYCLIDHLGFKGTQHGGAGVHKNQALVLVNLNAAKGKEVLDLAQKIQSAVKKTFNITLETEVNIL